MTWILVAVGVLGLVWFLGARTSKQGSRRALGKGPGNTGSAQYRNRSSGKRDKTP